MAPPQRFASVNSKARPAARVPFRDDTILVALRYEKTVQAEPPIPIIPIPARNPARQARPRSALSSTTTSPIVIARPPIPPQEQHPALRTRPIRPIAEEWKRDSGLAPTASSVTIRAESEDDDIFRKLDALDGAPSPYVGTGDRRRSFTTNTTNTTNTTTPNRQSRSETPEVPFQLFSEASFETPAELASPAASLRFAWEEAAKPAVPSSPVSPTTPASPASPTSSAAPSLAREASWRLAKRFSFRSSSSKRRKSEDSETPPTKSRGLKSPKSTKPKMTGQGGNKQPTPASAADGNFTPINTAIPTERLIEDDFLTSLTFSKRGSLMFGGKRAVGPAPASSMDTAGDLPGAQGSSQHGGGAAVGGDAADKPSKSTSLPSIRVLSLDVERESQKVRSLYESGDGINWEDGRPRSFIDGRLEPTEEVPSDEEENVASPSSDGQLRPDPTFLHTPRSVSSLSQRRDSAARREYELAGGIEDWEDVDGADVDRYGFISIRRPGSRATTPDTTPSRATTPRRRNVLVKRPDSAGYTSSPLGPGRAPSRKVSARSLNTQTSELSTVSRRSARSSMRAAANLLPHNKERRWMDDAGEMLTLAPGLADIAEDEQAGKISEALKKKEWERSEKWRKMAKVVKKGKDGEGMEFEFDAKNPKVIERTWKGIPDRWRAAAWYSFLATSAKRQGRKETDEQIVAEFHRLQGISSPDDLQIDLDVPRTINRHIMFRKRYRGGQRLLFRVLHALSLYFPDTGYVQGMASLAATLLCYYDEERCFVMLVRMWQVRGLEQLYQPGFEGLMTALRDLEKHWLAGKEVARKLSELSIDPTAYGTRWYLTLFNLSVPFPAQLRIWDVFMLLGDCPPAPALTPASESEPTASSSRSSDATKVGEAANKAAAASAASASAAQLRGLDILHAASTALIDGLSEVLLDSDFENAMKALTSWVPIKDEELLLKVTRAEWKQHQGKKRRG